VITTFIRYYQRTLDLAAFNSLSKLDTLALKARLRGTRVIMPFGGRSLIPYSGYFFRGGKIFVSSEFLASSWKSFRGRGILNHTPVLCRTTSWVKISLFASQPRKPRKFYPPPPKNTRYTVSRTPPNSRKRNISAMRYVSI